MQEDPLKGRIVYMHSHRAHHARLKHALVKVGLRGELQHVVDVYVPRVEILETNLEAIRLQDFNCAPVLQQHIPNLNVRKI